MRQIVAELMPSGGGRSAVRVHGIEDTPVDMWVESEGELARTLTGWVPVLTILAGATNSQLRLDGPVDGVAIRGASAAQVVMAGWYPDRIHTGGVQALELVDEAGGPGQAALFSGGVDSFYTVRRHLEEIEYLLFIHGMDIQLGDLGLFARSRDALEAAAAEMGKSLVVARTNQRGVMDRYADWRAHYHGAAMATVGLLHSPMWYRLFVAASHSREHVYPLGSHPNLDPLWSSAAVEVVHDGQADRPTKLEELGTWDVAMDHLRVCWHNSGGAYNCGRCAKCTRTMVGLHIAGALGRCRTLPEKLDYSRIVSLASEDRSWAFNRVSLAHSRRMRPRDVRLEVALLLSLARIGYRSSPIAPPLGRARRRLTAAFQRQNS